MGNMKLPDVSERRPARHVSGTASLLESAQDLLGTVTAEDPEHPLPWQLKRLLLLQERLNAAQAHMDLVKANLEVCTNLLASRLEAAGGSETA